MEEEFELKDSDVVTEVVHGIPTTIFFYQVHKYIERRMAKTIIMKLLGRSIGFNVLLKKITSLWCPRSPIQLMDLENDYYLIRFNSENDYNKVVFGSPWCGMYGHNTDFCLGKKAPLFEGKLVVDRKVVDKLVISKPTEEEDFSLCMLVERQQCQDAVLTVINGAMDTVQRWVMIDNN
ncbi:hypothetical protein PVK06_002690 [Gossypium arboreum]|uniref:DUF4283 domain-containing protein n=1 Tax=Gossypium arboreum TaxID=29729 RepID=A0ABR0R4E7_GOSAR|nr:hypothetical protein PVK06_002690 [Gossypium arboreum]